MADITLDTTLPTEVQDAIDQALRNMPYGGGAFYHLALPHSLTLGRLVTCLDALAKELRRVSENNRATELKLDGLERDLQGTANLFNRVTDLAAGLEAEG